MDLFKSFELTSVLTFCLCHRVRYLGDAWIGFSISTRRKKLLSAVCTAACTWQAHVGARMTYWFFIYFTPFRTKLVLVWHGLLGPGKYRISVGPSNAASYQLGTGPSCRSAVENSNSTDSAKHGAKPQFPVVNCLKKCVFFQAWTYPATCHIDGFAFPNANRSAISVVFFHLTRLLVYFWKCFCCKFDRFEACETIDLKFEQFGNCRSKICMLSYSTFSIFTHRWSSGANNGLAWTFTNSNPRLFPSFLLG